MIHVTFFFINHYQKKICTLFTGPTSPRSCWWRLDGVAWCNQQLPQPKTLSQKATASPSNPTSQQAQYSLDFKPKQQQFHIQYLGTYIYQRKIGITFGPLLTRTPISLPPLNPVPIFVFFFYYDVVRYHKLTGCTFFFYQQMLIIKFY